MMKKAIFFLLLINLQLLSQNDSLIKLFNTANADTEKVNILNKIIFSAERINLDTAKFWAKKLITLTNEKKIERGYGYYNNHKGRLKLYEQNLDSAITYFKKAFDNYKKDGYIKGQISANNNIATCYGEMGLLDKSLEYNFINVEISKSTGNEVTLADAYINIASCYVRSRNLNLGIRYALKALELYNKNNVEDKLGYCYYNLGSVNYDLKNFEDAEKYALLSIKYFEKIKLLNMAVRNHIILSNTYYDTKQYHKAIKVAHEGLRIDKQAQVMSVESFLYNCLSQSYLKLKNLDSALFYSEKAVNTSKKINSLATKMNTFYQLGIVCFQANKVNEAIKLLDSSLFFALKVGDLNVQHNVYQYLALCHKKLNNKDKCIEYMERQLLLRDSLGVINNLNSINEQRIMFDTEEKEKELLKSENNLKLIALESKRKTTILLISLFALIFSISFAVIALINYRKSKKAAKYIEQQKDQLEEKQKEILDSIKYAKRIQQSILPTNAYLEKKIKSD